MRGAIGITIMALAGCAQVQPPTPRPPDPFIACADAIQTLPIRERLAGKVPLNGSATLAMLADNSKPTEAEREAISAVYDEYEKCSIASRSWRLVYLPSDLRATREAWLNGRASLRAELYRGALTYGEYNTKVRDLNTRSEAEWNERMAEGQRREASARQQAEANEQARRREAAAWILAHPPAPITLTPIQTRPITTTNCTTLGNYTNCTTQ